MAEETGDCRLARTAQSVRKVTVEIATTVLVLFGFVAFFSIVTGELGSSKIVIEPIYVQPDLIGKGAFSGEVVARRLRDAMNNVVADVKRNSEFRKDATLEARIEEESRKLATLSLPGAGFDFENAVNVVRTFARQSVIVVGGELVADGRGWSLHIRSNRHSMIYEQSITSSAQLNAAIDAAGKAAVGMLDPILAAVAAYETVDYKAAALLAERALARNESAGSRSRAHFVLGAVKAAEAAYHDAEIEYLRAIREDPRNAIAYSSLGYVLRVQAREALFSAIPDLHARSVASYRRATRLAPGLALAHNGLGLSLLATWCRGREPPSFRDHAIAAHRQAVKLSPNEDGFRNNLAKVSKPEEDIDCPAP